MTILNTLRDADASRYFASSAVEKARIRNIKVNGLKATAIFKEYNAPEELKEEFAKYNSDGHFFYITLCVWSGNKSYYTGKPISTAYDFLTDKEEGNKIYTQLKETGELNNIEFQ